MLELIRNLELTPWQWTAVAIVAAVLIHLVIKLVVLRGLNGIGASTDKVDRVVGADSIVVVGLGDAQGTQSFSWPLR